MKDIYALREAIDAGTLMPLQQYDSTFYRCRGIGVTSGDMRRNDRDLINVKPHLQTTLQNITVELNEKLKKMGFPSDHYWVRVIVTSAMRPANHNDKIRGSSDTSAHMYGIAVDLSKMRFDLIDKEAKKFYQISGTSDELGVNDKHRMHVHAYTALTHVLKEMEDRGDIFVNREGDHLHIVDKKWNEAA